MSDPVALIINSTYPAVAHIDDEDVSLVLEAQEVALVIIDTGIPGPPGLGGIRHQHIQSSALTTWVVNHNLGYRPSSVRVLSVGGVELNAGVVDVSDNQLQIQFALPVAGSVIVG